jgi:hypothetical protein
MDIIVGLLKCNGHIRLVGQSPLVSKAQRVRLELRGQLYIRFIRELYKT